MRNLRITGLLPLDEEEAFLLDPEGNAALEDTRRDNYVFTCSFRVDEIDKVRRRAKQVGALNA